MRNFSKLLLTAAGVFALGVTHASAVPIAINSGTGVFNTGLDASGALLPYNSTDPHYVIAPGSTPNPLPTDPAIAEKTMDSSNPGNFPIPPWLGDDSASRWDSQSTDGDGGEVTGTFHNVTTFVSPYSGTVTITGQWSLDDFGIDILVNGASTGNTAPSGSPAPFQIWTPFTITKPVVAGVNTLDFVQGQGGSPGGVRVEFFTASVTPEPASVSLLGLGALSLLGRRRRA